MLRGLLTGFFCNILYSVEFKGHFMYLIHANTLQEAFYLRHQPLLPRHRTFYKFTSNSVFFFLCGKIHFLISICIWLLLNSPQSKEPSCFPGSYICKQIPDAYSSNFSSCHDKNSLLHSPRHYSFAKRRNIAKSCCLLDLLYPNVSFYANVLKKVSQA